MKSLLRIWLIPLLFQFAQSGCSAMAANEDEEVWAPTPPRVSYLDGEVSYWRQGADAWSRAAINLPLAEGDALYAGSDANFEVQFGSRSFVRGDEKSQLTLLDLEEGYIHFKVSNGLVSFDLRRISAGSRLEVSTPNAVFFIEEPGYYRVEVESDDTHFITRRGGVATLATADGRTLSIYPSEDIVVTAGRPVKVATYAAPSADGWDRWNDARSERLGDSVSARYLSPDIYGTEELDHYGHWRVVASYGAVWIPYGVSVGWVPYSTGYWVWDPYYEWTWVDEAPWGWAPFHYGRWVFIDGYWAWAPGPVVRRTVYAPALVAFITPGAHVSLSVALPGVWWVALGWGEPLLPWWHRHRYRGHPRWDGWGGPRIVNEREYRERPFTDVAAIRYRNAALKRAVVTVPPDTFGRQRIAASVETRFRQRDFTPLRGEVPIKPSRESLTSGAPRSVEPPREISSRPVVTTRPPRPLVAPPWQQPAPRASEPPPPESRIVIPPAPRSVERRALPRPPFGAETGAEVTPPPQLPRYYDLKRLAPLAPVTRPPAPPQGEPPAQRGQPRQQPVMPRGETPEGRSEQRPLPGQPASQLFKRRLRERE